MLKLKKRCNFVRFCFGSLFRQKMKRELGENPRQSRCCIFQKKLHNPATVRLDGKAMQKE